MIGHCQPAVERTRLRKVADARQGSGAILGSRDVTAPPVQRLAHILAVTPTSKRCRPSMLVAVILQAVVHRASTTCVARSVGTCSVV